MFIYYNNLMNPSLYVLIGGLLDTVVPPYTTISFYWFPNTVIGNRLCSTSVTLYAEVALHNNLAVFNRSFGSNCTSYDPIIHPVTLAFTNGEIRSSWLLSWLLIPGLGLADLMFIILNGFYNNTEYAIAILIICPPPSYLYPSIYIN